MTDVPIRAGGRPRPRVLCSAMLSTARYVLGSAFEVDAAHIAGLVSAAGVGARRRWSRGRPRPCVDTYTLLVSPRHSLNNSRPNNRAADAPRDDRRRRQLKCGRRRRRHGDTKRAERRERPPRQGGLRRGPRGGAGRQPDAAEPRGARGALRRRPLAHGDPRRRASSGLRAPLGGFRSASPFDGGVLALDGGVGTTLV